VDGVVLRDGAAADGEWFPGVVDPARRVQLTQIFTYDPAPPGPESEEADFLVQVVRRRPIIFYRALPAGREFGSTEFRSARQFFRGALRDALGPAESVLADTLLGSRGAASDAQEADDLPGDGVEPMDVVVRLTGQRDADTLVGYASCHFHISARPFTLGEASFALACDLPGFLKRLNDRAKAGSLDVQLTLSASPGEPVQLSPESPVTFSMPSRVLPNGTSVPDLSGARFVLQTSVATSVAAVDGGGSTPDGPSCLIIQGPVELQRQPNGTYRAFVNGVEVAWQADWQQV